MSRRLSDLKSAACSENQYLDQLVKLFQQNGWDVKREPLSAGKCAGLVISQGDLLYIVALRVSSQGRRDRLVALLAQVILQARAAALASESGAEPLAVAAAPAIPRSTVKELMSFLTEVAPNDAVGIFDQEGFRRFVGPGLEKLTAVPTRTARTQRLRVPDSANLFSDLNQRMLKVLLAPLIPEDLLQAPRGEYRNATELAEAAEVSVMSAFRFVRQLEQEGFLDNVSEMLRLVRREELMHRWQATYLRAAPALPLWWIHPGNCECNLETALRTYNDQASVRERSAPRACLDLFAAAEALGYGPVQGILPHFYIENLDREVLQSMGLSPDDAEYRPNVFVRVPVFQKSVFRSAVNRNGVPVADIIQVWLEVSSHSARDETQANEIRQHALAQIFAEQT